MCSVYNIFSLGESVNRTWEPDLPFLDKLEALRGYLS